MKRFEFVDLSGNVMDDNVDFIATDNKYDVALLIKANFNHKNELSFNVSNYYPDDPINEILFIETAKNALAVSMGIIENEEIEI